MTELNRDDLRIRTDRGRPDDWPLGEWFNEPTDAEFDAIARKEGYVRLDVDVVAAEFGKRALAWETENGLRTERAQAILLNLLDALGPEGPTL